MAISFIGATEFANGIANVTSAPLATPGGTANGDLMIAHIVIRDEGFTITAPAGWTEIPVTVNEADHEMRWYQRVANAEPGSRSWTFSSGTATACGLITLRGAVNPHGSSVADGIAVLNHTTNSVTTLGAGAWLLGGWSCQALLTVGWAAPGTMTERTESIGGLIVLLNAEEMTATQGPVVVGSYSRTATTVDPVQSINSLLAVEAIIDPLLATPLTLRPNFGAAIMGPPGIVGTPLTTFATFGSSIVGPPGINGAGSQIVVEQDFGAAQIVAGEVFVGPSQVITRTNFGAPTVGVGGVFVGNMPWMQPQVHGSHTATPGEVTVLAEPVSTDLIFGPGHELVPAYLISNETPLVGGFEAPGGTLGLGIIPPLSRIELRVFESFSPTAMIFGVDFDFQGPCCN